MEQEVTGGSTHIQNGYMVCHFSISLSCSIGFSVGLKVGKWS